MDLGAGHVLNITQHASLSPVHFHVRADLKAGRVSQRNILNHLEESRNTSSHLKFPVQVAGDATVFVAYNETGLRQLQRGSQVGNDLIL